MSVGHKHSLREQVITTSKRTVRCELLVASMGLRVTYIGMFGGKQKLWLLATTRYVSRKGLRR